MLAASHSSPLSYRERLERIYRLNAPDKLANIDNVLFAFAGREEFMITSAVKKYGPEPTDEFYAIYLRSLATRPNEANEEEAQRATAQPSAAQGSTNGSRLTYAQRLMWLMLTYCPEQILLLDDVLYAYRGNQDKMIQDFVEEYGAEPAIDAQRSRLIHFYEYYCPEKIPSVDRILSAYVTEGFDRLMADLVCKYGPEPSTYCATTFAEDKEAANKTMSAVQSSSSTRSELEKQFALQRLSDFYSYYCPQKLPFVDEIVATYSMHPRGIRQLFRSLEEKYGPEPCKLTAGRDDLVSDTQSTTGSDRREANGSARDTASTASFEGGGDSSSDTTFEEVSDRLYRMILFYDPKRLADLYSTMPFLSSAQAAEQLQQWVAHFGPEPSQEALQDMQRLITSKEVGKALAKVTTVASFAVDTTSVQQRQASQDEIAERITSSLPPPTSIPQSGSSSGMAPASSLGDADLRELSESGWDIVDTTIPAVTVAKPVPSVRSMALFPYSRFLDDLQQREALATSNGTVREGGIPLPHDEMEERAIAFVREALKGGEGGVATTAPAVTRKRSSTFLLAESLAKLNRTALDNAVPRVEVTTATTPRPANALSDIRLVGPCCESGVAEEAMLSDVVAYVARYFVRHRDLVMATLHSRLCSMYAGSAPPVMAGDAESDAEDQMRISAVLSAATLQDAESAAEGISHDSQQYSTRELLDFMMRIGSTRHRTVDTARAQVRSALAYACKYLLKLPSSYLMSNSSNDQFVAAEACESDSGATRIAVASSLEADVIALNYIVVVSLIVEQEASTRSISHTRLPSSASTDPSTLENVERPHRQRMRNAMAHITKKGRSNSDVDARSTSSRLTIIEKEAHERGLLMARFVRGTMGIVWHDQLVALMESEAMLRNGLDAEEHYCASVLDLDWRRLSFFCGVNQRHRGEWLAAAAAGGGNPEQFWAIAKAHAMHVDQEWAVFARPVLDGANSPTAARPQTSVQKDFALRNVVVSAYSPRALRSSSKQSLQSRSPLRQQSKALRAESSGKVETSGAVVLTGAHDVNDKSDVARGLFSTNDIDERVLRYKQRSRRKQASSGAPPHHPVAVTPVKQTPRRADAPVAVWKDGLRSAQQPFASERWVGSSVYSPRRSVATREVRSDSSNQRHTTTVEGGWTASPFSDYKPSRQGFFSLQTNFSL